MGLRGPQRRPSPPLLGAAWRHKFISAGEEQRRDPQDLPGQDGMLRQSAEKRAGQGGVEGGGGTSWASPVT